jgi:uncharacterized protein (DUF305 family)
MKATSIILSVVLISGCQRTETPAETAPAAMDTAATTAAAAPYDLQFIDSMIRHHQMAVDMAKAGEPKFAHAPLKQAAKKIVENHTKEIAQLRQWRDQWYPGAAPAENMQMPGMASMNMDMSHMQTMSGQQLDMMFIDMMIPHHEGAIAMAQDALQKAEHQEIKDLAQKMANEQQKEIAQLKQWKQAWSRT